MTITLVPKAMAKEGSEFYYIANQEDCGDCKFKNVCFNLEEGCRYRVNSVRSQTHPCQATEGEVVIVDAQMVAEPAILPKKGLIEGVTLTFKPINCGRVDCINWRLCHPPVATDGQKYTVVHMGKDVKCPIGEKLAFVDML